MKGKCGDCPGYNDCPRMKGESYCLSSSPTEGTPAGFDKIMPGVPATQLTPITLKKKSQKKKENKFLSTKNSF